MNMNIALSAAVMSLLAVAAIPAQAADVGVSISVGQPGFYGHIELGDFPRPRIIYAQPVMVERRRGYQEPIYLHVRPGHARHWKKHCREYDACGRPVYFVNDNWYNTVYVPQYQQREARRQHGDGNRGDYGDHDRGNDHGRDGRGDQGREHGRDDGRGYDHDHDQGRRHD